MNRNTSESSAAIATQHQPILIPHRVYLFSFFFYPFLFDDVRVHTTAVGGCNRTMGLRFPVLSCRYLLYRKIRVQCSVVQRYLERLTLFSFGDQRQVIAPVETLNRAH